MSYTDRLFKEGSAFTRFSHHARAEKTMLLIRASGKNKFNQVLDYGCADGWFLRALYDNGMAKQGVGVDINDDDLAKSRALFADIPSFQFIKTTELSPDLDGKFFSRLLGNLRACGRFKGCAFEHSSALQS